MTADGSSDRRRGVGLHRVARPPESSLGGDVAAFPADGTVWARDYRTKAMRKSFPIDLHFLQELEHGADLVNAFWSRYGGSNYAAPTLRGVLEALKLWAKFCGETGVVVHDCSAISEDVMRAFLAWIARRERTRRDTLSYTSRVLECVAAGADLESPNGGEKLRAAKSALLLSCRRLDRGLGPPKALDDDNWQRLLETAAREVKASMAGYRAGDVPEAGTKLVPFIVLVAAHTGANPVPLLTFRRDAWKPEAVLDGYWRVSWLKGRAHGHEEQSLVFAATVKMGVSLIEVLEFVKRWTEPLVERVAESCRDDLWLYVSRHNKPFSAAWEPRNFTTGSVRSWLQQNRLKIQLDQIRSSAALTLLRSGKSLTHVQSFLQHTELNTTWRYVRSDVLQSRFNRAITLTQERIVGRVVPQARATGVGALALPAAVREKLAAGAWDVGTCGCLDPYNSPVPGEIKGRLCRSFHACYACPHAVWFKEHLPLEAWKLHRFESLRASDPDWARKYGQTCEVIRRDILGAFPEEDRRWADAEASRFATLPILVADGVSV